MAINPTTEYPGRVAAASADYPYSSSKNETSPGAGDGTPYELARANDIFGLQQALLAAASIVPSGNADTALVSEYMQAIVELASGRANTFDDSGAADAYVLAVKANQQGPRSYFAGLKVSFSVNVTNTGASTIDVHGLGVKDIKNKDGSPLAASALIAGEFLTLQYNGTHFIIDSEGTVQTGTNANGTAIKFPDGTMICLMQHLAAITMSAYLAGLNNGSFSYTYPVAFVGALPTLGFGRTADNVTNGWCGGGGASSLTNGTSKYFSSNGAVTASNIQISAIGRWK